MQQLKINQLPMITSETYFCESISWTNSFVLAGLLVFLPGEWSLCLPSLSRLTLLVLQWKKKQKEKDWQSPTKKHYKYKIQKYIL